MTIRRAYTEPMWELDEAVQFIQGLEPHLREINYHTLLAGSVLHKGSSRHDLDIWIIPLNTAVSRSEDVRKVLEALVGPIQNMKDDPAYSARIKDGRIHCTEFWRTTDSEQVIDFFVV